MIVVRGLVLSLKRIYRVALPGEPNHNFSVKQTWSAVKGWPMEIISTYIQEHNQGGQPCKAFAGNAQKVKI